MKTDRELLELAAKAAGQFVDRITSEGVWIYEDGVDRHGFGKGLPCLWNTLASDGDALRLAVKLGIQIHFEGDMLNDAVWANEIMIWTEGEPEAATRRAITRAAAAIGEQQNELSREA
jgi:hypothetical protein